MSNEATAKPYPPYSGPDVVCPKCGHEGARTEFLRYGQCVHGNHAETFGFEPNERLHRECQRCDYAWDEATVEQPGEPT